MCELCRTAVETVLHFDTLIWCIIELFVVHVVSRVQNERGQISTHMLVSML